MGCGPRSKRYLGYGLTSAAAGHGPVNLRALHAMFRGASGELSDEIGHSKIV